MRRDALRARAETRYFRRLGLLPAARADTALGRGAPANGPHLREDRITLADDFYLGALGYGLSVGREECVEVEDERVDFRPPLYRTLELERGDEVELPRGYDAKMQVLGRFNTCCDLATWMVIIP